MHAVATPRAATVEDIDELTRLRGVMLAAVDAEGWAARVRADPGWAQRCRARFAELLGSAAFAVFVVDAPDGGLAACGAGWVDRRLPSPGGTGLAGFVSNMCTDPAHRRRGHARAVLTALMDWFAGQGVSRVDLHATEEGRRVYAAAGFRPPQWQALRWTAPRG